MAIIGAIANNGGGSQSSVSDTGPQNNGLAEPVVAPPATTLLDVTGSGIKTTASFTVGQNWDMPWSYDCSDAGGKGNFIVSVMTAGGHMSRNAGTNQLGTSGTDVEHFHQGGTFYLEVNSECSWHVTVRG